jgi:8-oxo-dGTP diphosphatase
MLNGFKLIFVILTTMKHLLTLKDQDVFPDAESMDSTGWFKRNAARAIVSGEKGQIYLLKMSTYNYHKLPGGGVEQGETLEDAVYRELLEEIGCPAEVVKELGEIIEYRSEEKTEQHSYCYTAKQTGPLRDTALEASEIEEGAETIVAQNLDEAIKLLEDDKPTSYQGHFIRLRDLRFLNEAKSLLQ